MGKIQKYINIVITVLIIIGTLILFSSDRKENEIRKNNSNTRNSLFETTIDTLVPVSINGSVGFPETVEQIMAREKRVKRDSSKREFRMKEEFEVDRKNLPQNSESPDISQYPPLSKSDREKIKDNPSPMGPQTLGTSFTGATLAETGAFPPDVMGAVGPTQFIVAVNGRIKTFNKSTGAEDGVLNADMDIFWTSVMTPPVNSNFTSDPRIRYDRLSQRWFVIIIDVPGGAGALTNRVLLAVSSSSTITSSSNFTFYFFNPETSSYFIDYPTLGIDANALYIGANIFNTSGGAFYNTSCYVVRKSSVISGGPLVFNSFKNLLVSNAGPFTPQGVDNYDPSATEGYIIGVDNATFGTLMLRRISDPGGTPTISANISITVPATNYPVLVNHLGNTKGNNGRLDALDDRLFAAHFRNGKLWTAHNIGVNYTGTTTSANRNAVRWYELTGIPTSQTPALIQSGTLYDPTTPNDATRRNYWIPSVMVSGQGHAAFGFSVAGSSERINSGTVGRLSGDVLGTLQTPVLYTATSTAYNPPSDPGGTGGRRWGDYSYTSLDPEDDMTMWTIQEYCDAANSYGVRAVQLKAPLPATPVSSVPNIVSNVASVSVVITGSSVSGSGWFDPGTGFTKHINATLSNGATLNSITYTDPLHVTLNINTSGAASPSSPNADVPVYVTIINPDGQFVTSSSPIITVQGALPVSLSAFNSITSGRDVKLTWTTSSELNNSGFDVERAEVNNQKLEFRKTGFVKGSGTSNSLVNYTFEDMKLKSGKYKYRLRQIDYNGNFEYHNLSTVVDVALPTKFNLSQNYPNPFNPTTKIDFDLPFDSKVNIVIYDITGKEVKTLLSETKTAGYHTVQFNVSDLSSGIYLYRIVANSANNDFVLTKKMMLLK